MLLSQNGDKENEQGRVYIKAIYHDNMDWRKFKQMVKDIIYNHRPVLKKLHQTTRPTGYSPEASADQTWRSFIHDE